MANSVFQHRRMRQAVALLLLSGSFFCVFPADNPFIRSWANNAEWVCLGYLALGLLCFITNQKRLMFVSMGCCAAMCLYFLEMAPHQIPSEPKPLDMPVADSLQEQKRPKL